MAIAIYSRKSKVTETGDSIENQIRLCKDYAKAHFPHEADIRIYEDEGFSGGNTARPMFQKLLADVARKKITVLICYRLDRISRNVVDFSATLELLEENQVDFVSIRENFDTSSPMGKAMVYISSVFAQLERETIGQRIKDNLLEMAKTGRYLQAKAPIGFEKEKVAYTDKNGHPKEYNLLKVNEDERDLVQYIFQHYGEHQSLTALEKEFIDKGIKTRRGVAYQCVTLRRVLEHPIYCTADGTAYAYFKNLKCNILNPPGDFDGRHGIYIYRRYENKNNKTRENPAGLWHVGVGAHDPIVSSDKWIKVQEILESRRVHTTRRPISKTALLSGILKCGECGGDMRPYAKVGDRFYYICTTKESSKGQLCQMKNIRGDLLDKKLFSDLWEMTAKTNPYEKILERKKGFQKSGKTFQEQRLKIDRTISDNKSTIQSLMKKLAQTTDETVEAYIQAYIKELDGENQKLQKNIRELEELSAGPMVSVETIKERFDCFIKEDEKALQVRRNLVKSIIKEIQCQKETLQVYFYKD